VTDGNGIPEIGLNSFLRTLVLDDSGLKTVLRRQQRQRKMSLLWRLKTLQTMMRTTMRTMTTMIRIPTFHKHNNKHHNIQATTATIATEVATAMAAFTWVYCLVQDRRIPNKHINESLSLAIDAFCFFATNHHDNDTQFLHNNNRRRARFQQQQQQSQQLDDWKRIRYGNDTEFNGHGRKWCLSHECTRTIKNAGVCRRGGLFVMTTTTTLQSICDDNNHHITTTTRQRPTTTCISKRRNFMPVLPLWIWVSASHERRLIISGAKEEAQLKTTTCIKNLSNADANDAALLQTKGLPIVILSFHLGWQNLRRHVPLKFWVQGIKVDLGEIGLFILPEKATSPFSLCAFLDLVLALAPVTLRPWKMWRPGDRLLVRPWYYSAVAGWSWTTPLIVCLAFGSLLWW
jgi:hypothetical protein